MALVGQFFSVGLSSTFCSEKSRYDSTGYGAGSKAAKYGQVAGGAGGALGGAGQGCEFIFLVSLVVRCSRKPIW
jgi:hypothetical protein